MDGVVKVYSVIVHLILSNLKLATFPWIATVCTLAAAARTRVTEHFRGLNLSERRSSAGLGHPAAAGSGRKLFFAKHSVNSHSAQ